MALDYNDSSTWLNSAIHAAPSGVNAAAYQARIDRICGLTPGGVPTVLLTWCPAMDNYSKYYASWDAGGFGQNYYWRALYKFRTVYDPQGNPVDIPPPRWALKQYQSPAQYLESDEATRWQKAANGSQVAQKELRPPRSRTGRYIPFISIGRHDKDCCRAAAENGDRCYGDYRMPDDAYLNLLTAAIRLRNEEANGQNPNEPISAATLQKAAIEAAQIEEENRRKSDELLSDMVDEEMSGIIDKVLGTGANKSFSLPPNYQKTEGGLILPN